MLRVRKSQMTALDDAAQATFHQALLGFLRKEIPEATAEFTDEQLLERVRESTRRAANYGIESNAGVAQFACLTFIGGTAFDEIPEVQAFLKSEGNGPEEKLDELVDCLAEMEDDEA